MSLSTLFPATVVVAIALFIVREVLEHRKRQAADGRKLSAIKTIIARECELNNWTIRKLKECVREMHEAVNDGRLDRTPSVSKDWTGADVFEVISGDGTISRRPVPKVKREFMERQLMEVAALDRNFFKLFQTAYDDLADVEHVRASLLTFAAATSGDDLLYRQHFQDYALGVLDDAYTSMNALYMEATNRPLTAIRLR